MRTFKDRISKIENILELLSSCSVKHWDWLNSELRHLLDDEAENIVQLAKTAADMRQALHDAGITAPACEEYDNLLTNRYR
jgi:hypothetical protein